MFISFKVKLHLFWLFPVIEIAPENISFGSLSA